MSRSALLLIVLLVLIIATLPNWRYAAGWNMGYYPSGVLGLVLLVLLIMLIMGLI